ncbi:reticulon family protein [Wolbachia pipientis]|uniref:hypothetical protein n=1 Tax=Wolbachia pipientis TaxID=955 RepID=UPI0025A4AE73|nr:hypothetical protein [Wolbachia pipientis]MDM8335076.1 hypothetical protein [Wolbachia pipientis]
MIENPFNGNNDSSIFKVKIREQDLSAEEKLNELKGAVEEIAKKSALKRLKLEREACGHVDGIFSQVEQNNEEDFRNVLSGVELPIKEEEDYFTSGIDTLLQELFKFLKPLFNEFDVDVDPKIFNMIKERKEKSWLASIIRFLYYKVKGLINKVFSKDLSLNEKIIKEIKKLEERLFDGDLPEEKKIEILKRLAALHDLKLKLQTFAVGWILTALATFFEIDLTVAIKTGTTKEVDKKAKETSTKEKEATKEVCEYIRIKVDERERARPIVQISLFDFSSGIARPIPLTKPQLDLLSNFLKNMIHSVYKYDMNRENRELKETKAVKENEQEKSTEFIAMCPSALEQSAANTEGSTENRTSYGCSARWARKGNQDSSDIYKQASNQPAQSSIPNRVAPKQSVKSSVAGYEYDFTNLKGSEHELQQSPMSSAQPTNELNNVEITVCQSTERAPSLGR